MKLFEKLIGRNVPMCFVGLLKHRYIEQTMQLKWSKHLSEPFHVTNGVRQGGILSPYLFGAYLDDLSIELNNIITGCYIGEVLLRHLMFAGDICVFCPSERGLQSRCVSGLCRIAWNYFNYNKTVCMTFKTKERKQHGHPVADMILSFQMKKTIQRQLRYQYCAANKLWASFSRCSNAVKSARFRSVCSLHPCMHHNYGVFSRRHTRRDCVWPILLVAGLHTTCRGAHVLVQCNIPTFEALLKKMYPFLERCKKSKNVWLRALMQSDCLYSSLFFAHYNRILLFD